MKSKYVILLFIVAIIILFMVHKFYKDKEKFSPSNYGTFYTEQDDDTDSENDLTVYGINASVDSPTSYDNDAFPTDSETSVTHDYASVIPQNKNANSNDFSHKDYTNLRNKFVDFTAMQQDPRLNNVAYKVAQLQLGNNAVPKNLEDKDISDVYDDIVDIGFPKFCGDSPDNDYPHQGYFITDVDIDKKQNKKKMVNGFDNTQEYSLVS